MAEWRDHRPASSAGGGSLSVRAQKGPGDGNSGRVAVEWESVGRMRRRWGQSPSPPQDGAEGGRAVNKFGVFY
jgi:hypothetical protein